MRAASRPHFSKRATSPIHVIYRPSGDTAMVGLQPDIPLPHDPLAPERMIEAALRLIAVNE
ncbi:hypothetical protein [Luteimonas salinilitoris]|uniref:Uncharacterized protein n=1 Tax=Luteimonas salinilitoris TaxID=3237697 RepID=A0ABV4HPE4_9GAMM